MRKKRALVVVDYQNDFVTGPLGFEKAARLERPLVQKICSAKQAHCAVLFTLDKHKTADLDCHGEKAPKPHCLFDTTGWNLYGKVADCCDETTPIFTKCTYGSLSLANYLNRQRFSEIALVGLVTNICVFSNALLAQAACPRARISVDAGCVACPEERDHLQALKTLQMLHIQIHNCREEYFNEGFVF